jgi:hypothetical protein
VACGLVGFELSEGLGTDVSSEAQIRKLQSYWVSNRRSAATELARFPNETDKVVPALVKTWPIPTRRCGFAPWSRLDTDICSAQMKANPRVHGRFIQHGGRLHVSAVTLGELFAWVGHAKASPRRM